MDSLSHNTASDDSSLPPSRLRRPVRDQVEMRFVAVDHLVRPEHPVRQVWAVVESLDLSGFRQPIKARVGTGGRNATDPRLLVAIWLYACIRGIGSARELARWCDPEEGMRPFLWLCGGVSLNHHLLSDFRVEHGPALDALFTCTLASLVKQNLVKVKRISQDGTRVRASAGAASFRRVSTLGQLLLEAQQHVEALKKQMDDPHKAGAEGMKKQAAQKRAARQRQERIVRATELIPELIKKQERLARKMSAKQKQAKLREPRASTTDEDARVMKMSNGGFNPAVNVQLAVDTDSRAIVGVETINVLDPGQSEPMRKQVEERTGQKVKEHLMDGGYLVMEEIERAASEGVDLFVPPKAPRNPEKFGSQFDPRPRESQAIKDWRQRMGTEEAKVIYKQRASTVETVNAHLKSHGLGPLLVRGLKKAKCVALWCALAYNLSLFGQSLAG